MGSAFCPSFCIVLADIGKAEIPAAPTMGFIFFPSGRKRFSIFAVNTPPAVSRTNATSPMQIMTSVLMLTNFSSVIVAAMEKPSNMGKFYIGGFWHLHQNTC